MKLSIIIPVYNVELYIEKCIRSCEQQDIPYEEYELIIVNDGSPDHSIDIINRLAREYNNIRVYSQKNSGLSIARNIGLSHAQGDFIWFVDSDDWIKSNCLKDITTTLYNDNLDALLIRGIRVEGSNYYYKKEDPPYVNQIVTGNFLLKNTIINCAAVLTIYRRDFLYQHNLKFYEGIFHEDHEFSPRAYYYINRIKVTSYNVYFNLLVPGSITQSINPKKGFDLIIVAKNLHKFAAQRKINSDKKIYNYYIIVAINEALYNASKMNDLDRRKFIQELNLNRNLFKSFFKVFKLKYNIEGILLFVCPAKFISIYKKIH